MAKKIIIAIIALGLIVIGAKKIHLYTKIYCTLKTCEVAKPVDTTTTMVTFPEGYTVKQIIKTIAEKTPITAKELSIVLKHPEKNIGLPTQANGLVEGWLFPDTYQYSTGVTAKEFLKLMVNNTINHLESASVPKDKWHDTIILASMIEKEAKIASDKPKVARVFLNRLDKGMLLQSDATVSYGSGSTDSVWTTDEQRADNNGYNTYKRAGLPIGAICNPGMNSIEAAVHPATGKWLYFVVVNLDSGKTVFSYTSAQHLKAVQQLKNWISKH